MNGQLVSKVNTMVKVRDFLGANPFGTSPGDQFAAQFAEKVNRAQVLFTQQEAGEVAAAASTDYRKGLKRQIVAVPARHVAKISQAVAAAHPEVSAGHRVSAMGRSQPEFVAKAQVMLQEAQANLALYIEHGLSEESLQELAQLLKAYLESIGQSNAARRAHTGAQKELSTLGRELMRMLTQLDGMMLYRLRNQPELQGAWASARNLAWPAPQAKAEAPPAKGAEPAA
jgi:hypothetical protein